MQTQYVISMEIELNDVSCFMNINGKNIFHCWYYWLKHTSTYKHELKSKYCIKKLLLVYEGM